MKHRLIQILSLTFVAISIAEKEIKVRGKNNKMKERNILKVDSLHNEKRVSGLSFFEHF